MQIITNATAKRYLDLEVGELCQVRLGGYGVGWVIMLSIGDGKKRETAILKVGDEFVPRIHDTDSFDNICLSYGKNWVLEVNNTGIEPKAADSREIPGAIYHYGNISAMYLAPFSSNQLYGCDLSFPSLTKTELPSDAIAVTKWKIWANENDRDDGAEPLLQFGY